VAVSGPSRVVAVVVTWNRRELLADALQAVTGQRPAPAHVVVVDNASTDGSADLVRDRFPGVGLLRAEQNTGGAGGFTIGIAEALRLDADVVWLMDDDTVPRPGALAALVAAREDYPGRTRPAVVASRVVWTDGRDHPMNLPRRRPGARVDQRRAAEAVGCMPIRSASFVSVLVDADVVRTRGLPVADFFLWNDDFEFTTRVIRGGVGLYCPASVVVHKTRVFGSTDADPGERFFYEVRNKIWTFGRSRGLSPVEKVLYGGSTLRRWARTFARSSDRTTLARVLGRGLVAGARHRPRTAEQFLAQTPVRRDGAAR
jgi:GT2 family glycosyltransferase